MKDSEPTSTSICARAEDLVAYLYNEASESEAQDFERHTEHCASCKAELAAFARVRSGIAEWRTEALGLVEATTSANIIEPVPERAQPSVRKPSALAALREFFALSPVWLRAATGLAALAICALVLLAGARIMQAPRVVFVERSVPAAGPSQADIDALVAKRVREELAARNKQEERTPRPIVTPVSEQSSPTLAQSTRPNSAQRRGVTQSVSGNRRKPARVSTDDYEQLARDLQLVPTRDEDDLPRLIDLIDEAN